MLRKIFKLFLIGLVVLPGNITFAEDLKAEVKEEVKKESLLSMLKIEASGGLDFYTKYIWRGFTLDNDPVIQPSFALSSYGFTAKFWSNWDADNTDGWNSDEMDYIFDYTKQFSIYKVFCGHIYYDFVGAGKFSREGYIGFGITEIPYIKWPIAMSITYFKDYGIEASGGGRGMYLSFDSSYSQVIYEKLGITVDLGFHYAYNRRLFINGRDGRDLGLKFGFTLPLTANLTIAPSVNYSMVFNDLKDSNDGAQKNRLYTGVSLTYKF